MTKEELAALEKRCVDEKLDGVFDDAYLVRYHGGEIMYGKLVVDMKRRALPDDRHINSSFVQSIHNNEIVVTLNSRYLALWRKSNRQR